MKEFLRQIKIKCFHALKCMLFPRDNPHSAAYKFGLNIITQIENDGANLYFTLPTNDKSPVAFMLCDVEADGSQYRFEISYITRQGANGRAPQTADLAYCPSERTDDQQYKIIRHGDELSFRLLNAITAYIDRARKHAKSLENKIAMSVAEPMFKPFSPIKMLASILNKSQATVKKINSTIPVLNLNQNYKDN